MSAHSQGVRRTRWVSDHERRLSVAAVDPRLRHRLDRVCTSPTTSSRSTSTPTIWSAAPWSRWRSSSSGRCSRPSPSTPTGSTRSSRYRDAHPILLAYSFFALTTLGHFLDGKPDIAPFWFATIFTDALAGLAVLAFTIWSIARSRSAAWLRRSARARRPGSAPKARRRRRTRASSAALRDRRRRRSCARSSGPGHRGCG